MSTSIRIPTAGLLRPAGLLYLVIIVCGIGGDVLVRGPLTADDPGQTVANLLAAEVPFRLSILADVAMVLADVALGVLLYRIFASVNRTLALSAMAFRLGQASVLAINLVHLVRALSLAKAPVVNPMRDLMVSSLLDAHAVGYDLGLFLFAVNCVLTGILLVRSELFPRIIGGGIVAAGAVYFVGSTLRIAAPGLAGIFEPAYVIPLVAELALCVALLAVRTQARGPAQL